MAIQSRRKLSRLRALGPDREDRLMAKTGDFSPPEIPEALQEKPGVLSQVRLGEMMADDDEEYERELQREQRENDD